VDSPNAAVKGFIESRIDLGRGEFKEIDPKNVGKAFFVPKLCNHCSSPACTQVCPVGATYKTDDGVILVDRTWCIGCGYCIMACPYAARFFHPVLHVVDKCTFCYHRLSKGLDSACVNACPFGARRMGNIHDPEDPITKIIMNERVGVLKDEFGTKPQAFYIGLAQEVR
jgi:Fe-S-cluster-containing dehydrogenase component